MADGKNLVGVDIGSSAIKVVQLKETRKGLSLVKLGFEPLPPQTIIDGHVMNSGAVVEALNKAFRDAGIKQKDVALGVSGQSVIIRKISVPLMTAAELDEQIQWEAEQHIPFDIKDVQIDYEVLRRRPEAGQMDLLLVAAKRDEINDYAELAREAKVRPTCVDIDAFCLQNVFEATYGLSGEATIALLNVGASLTSLNIVSKGISAFTRDIANGGGAFTEEIQKQLGVSREQAEAYKLGGTGTEPVPAQVQQVLAQVADGLAGEIQRSLDFFLATSGESEISRIYIAGGGASLPSLSQAIERRARVPVERFNPMTKIGVEAGVNPDVAAARGEQLAVAIGLALRKDGEKRLADATKTRPMIRVNLLPRRREAKREGGKAWIAILAILFIAEMAGIIVAHAQKKAVLDDLKNKNSDTEKAIADKRGKVANHEAVKKQLAEYQQREDAISKLQAGRSGPAAMMLELSRILTPGKMPTVDPEAYEKLRRENPAALPSDRWDPHRLWLISFKEADHNVQIAGLGKTNDDVAEFLRRLTVSRYFNDVKLVKTEEKAGSSGGNGSPPGAPAIAFDMRAKVRD